MPNDDSPCLHLSCGGLAGDCSLDRDLDAAPEVEDAGAGQDRNRRFQKDIPLWGGRDGTE